MKRFRPFAALGVLTCLAFAQHAQAQAQCNESNLAGLIIKVCLQVDQTTAEAGFGVGLHAWSQTRPEGNNNNWSASSGTMYIEDGSSTLTSGYAGPSNGYVYSTNFPFSSVGQHTLKAYSSSVRSPAITVTINRHTPVYRALSATPNVALANQQVKIFSEIELYKPAGTLTFSVLKPDGTTADVDSKAVSYPSGVYLSETRFFTFSGAYATPGTYYFGFRYSGDALNVANNSSSVQVRVGPFGTTTALSQSVVDTRQGVGFTLTASIGGALGGWPAPTGTVEFYDGTTLLGTATLDPQLKATYTTSLGSVGSHALKAKYLGDSNYQPSTSSNLAHGIQFNPAILVPVLEPVLE